MRTKETSASFFPEREEEEDNFEEKSHPLIFVCIGFRVYFDTLNNEKDFWFYPSLSESKT